MQKTYSYLALGDSYTIGEAVPLFENFPYQTVQLVRNNGISMYAPEIVAKTGWTTDELQEAVNQYRFLPVYDFVTLLIGVNNQYRGRTADNYTPEFHSLLKQAIEFAGNRPERVIVLSIPDWGVTPYAEGRNREEIARAIDTYNSAKQQISEQEGTQWINITPYTREATTDLSLLATDQLHPSGKDYGRWAKEVADEIIRSIKAS